MRILYLKPFRQKPPSFLGWVFYLSELCDAEKHIDESLLRPDMLPIDRDYALSLIDAFLVHHVVEPDDETDN